MLQFTLVLRKPKSTCQKKKKTWWLFFFSNKQAAFTVGKGTGVGGGEKLLKWTIPPFPYRWSLNGGEQAGLLELQILKGTSSPSLNSAENLPHYLLLTSKEIPLSGGRPCYTNIYYRLDINHPLSPFSFSFNHKLLFHFWFVSFLLNGRRSCKLPENHSQDKKR